MPNEYIQYIKREIVIDYPDELDSPFYAELQAYDEGFRTPKFHVTRSSAWPVKEIKENDIIWLVGQLSSKWGRLAPSLDAKIVAGSIQEIPLEDGKRKIRFSAKEGSMWVPLSDASEILSIVSIELKNGEIKLPFDFKKNNLGQVFQGIKKIHTKNLLGPWLAHILNNGTEFISYRIADGTKSVFLRAMKQTKEGKVIFWDRWSLPRRLAERREIVSDEGLDAYLFEKIADSYIVWGIESPKYSEEGCYLKKEKEFAVTLGKYKSSEGD